MSDTLSGLSTMNYLSEAGTDLTEATNVLALVRAARAANAAVGVTGAIACDGQRIRQWIEGPRSEVQGLWDRIRSDPRHRITWVDPARTITERRFPGSPMQLALSPDALLRCAADGDDDLRPLPGRHVAVRHLTRRDCTSCTCAGSCLNGPCAAGNPDIIRLDEVYRARRTAQTSAKVATLLERLACSASAPVSTSVGTPVGAPVGAPVEAPLPAPSPAVIAAALVDLSVGEAADLVAQVLDRLQADWLSDRLNLMQRGMALAILQGGLRRSLDLCEGPVTIGAAQICLLPGTPDCQGVIAKTALLRDAGWSVQQILPETIEEACHALAERQADVVILAGSRSQRRDCEVEMILEIMPTLRRRSDVPVIIGGKLAEDDPELARALGAVAACSRLSDLPWLVEGFAERRTPRDLVRSQTTAQERRMADQILSTLTSTVGMAASRHAAGGHGAANVLPFRR
ncbi:MAG: BLUF domain-containing protein [Rubellimicrobium sp.]|nr:BLUF domain-containing protein [Rubellimicrobium sp.]